jgi:hypothetical protein
MVPGRDLGVYLDGRERGKKDAKEVGGGLSAVYEGDEDFS